jgi:uncharacterized GH25 family protein
MRLRHALIAAAAVAATLSTPALAHRQWLLPSTTTLAGTSEYVTVDAAVSNDLFYADHVAIDPEQVQVWAPDGSKGMIENPAKGRYRGTFDVKIDKPGTWAIGIERAGVGGSFQVDGETWRVGMMRMRPGSAPVKSVKSVAEIPANATEVKLTESVSRNMTYVTAGAPTKTVFTPQSKGLAFDPITHPSELVSDEEAQFRFLVDGKPAAGVKVTIVPGGKKYRAAEDAQELTTGPDGVRKVTWPVAGMYWVSASVSDNKPSEARATERRMNFTTTLEVVAP